MPTYEEVKELMLILEHMHEQDLKLLVKCSGLDLKIYNNHSRRVMGMLARFGIASLLKEKDVRWVE